MKKIAIKSYNGVYDVTLLNRINFSVKKSDRRKKLILIDSHVYSLYKTRLKKLVETYPTLLVRANEREKTLIGVEKVLNFLQKSQATKKTILIGIGGGIIQDITTFVSNIFYRGIEWNYYPTTLLSMSDSCIGAKCGINFNKFKNQIGVFHPPKKVVIFREFLSTLREKDILSGYGEILKLSIMDSNKTYSELLSCLNKYGPNLKPIIKLIHNSLMAKKKIIEKDELETNLRRVLNYGHTFGHALEAATDNKINHGMAVIWGIDIANFISNQMNMLSEKNFNQLHNIIKKNFPIKYKKQFSTKKILNLVKKDKKFESNKINMALLQNPGNITIKPIKFDKFFFKIVDNYLRNHNVLHNN